MVRRFSANWNRSYNSVANQNIEVVGSKSQKLSKKPFPKKMADNLDFELKFAHSAIALSAKF